jgi:hypothetical protein
MKKEIEMLKNFRFELLIKTLLFVTPERTIDLVKLVRTVDNARRYIVEELDTPFLSSDSEYTVNDGGKKETIETTKEFIDYIDMAIADAVEVSINTM